MANNPNNFDHQNQEQINLPNQPIGGPVINILFAPNVQNFIKGIIEPEGNIGAQIELGNPGDPLMPVIIIPQQLDINGIVGGIKVIGGINIDVEME